MICFYDEACNIDGALCIKLWRLRLAILRDSIEAPAPIFLRRFADSCELFVFPKRRDETSKVKSRLRLSPA